jgi:hypothetical protein
MEHLALKAADIFFLVFHTGFMVWNVTAWIGRKTRPWHLLTLGLTALSWFGLGLFYGWGYCPCTDWHWQIRRALGDTDLPSSYTQFLAQELTGFTFSRTVSDVIGIVGIAVPGLLTVALMLRDKVREETRQESAESNERTGG